MVRGTVAENLQKELSELTKTYSSLKAEVEQMAFRHERRQTLAPADRYINELFINA